MPAAAVQPLAPARYKVQFTASAELHDKLECQRDRNRCRYVNKQGRRCSEREPLEFHHQHPFGVGGDHHPHNIRLMCRAHNAYLAEHDYGKATMARWHSGERVSGVAVAHARGNAIRP